MKILLLLTLSLTVFTTSHGQHLKFSYDKFEDRTNISTPIKGVKGASIDVQGYFNHKGKSIQSAPGYIGLVFYSHSRDWKYLSESDRQLFILADAERFTLDGARASKIESPRHRPYSRSRVTVSERLIFSITLQQLKQMLFARSLEMRMASETFSFSDDTIEVLRELLATAESKELR